MTYMDDRLIKAVLFDFDGVVMDTEKQYSVFWDDKGAQYLGLERFGSMIKGSTLRQIFHDYFSGKEDLRREISASLAAFEAGMDFEYIPGVKQFLEELKEENVMTAIVTSSDKKKMSCVFGAHPELERLVDTVVTADAVTRSKPAPDCFNLAMERLQVSAAHTVVFEDSLFGLDAGRASGAFVVGLTTTNARVLVAPRADAVIDDFVGLSYRKLEKLYRNEPC